MYKILFYYCLISDYKYFRLILNHTINIYYYVRKIVYTGKLHPVTYVTVVRNGFSIWQNIRMCINLKRTQKRYIFLRSIQIKSRSSEYRKDHIILSKCFVMARKLRNVLYTEYNKNYAANYINNYFCDANLLNSRILCIISRIQLSSRITIVNIIRLVTLFLVRFFNANVDFRKTFTAVQSRAAAPRWMFAIDCFRVFQ